MNDQPDDRAARQLEKYLEAVAAFARIGEEYHVLRAGTPSGPARERLDRMIQLNRETLTVVKRSLMISEGDLARQQRSQEVSDRTPAEDPFLP
jgi:hypothetical protein